MGKTTKIVAIVTAGIRMPKGRVRKKDIHMVDEAFVRIESQRDLFASEQHEQLPADSRQEPEPVPNPSRSRQNAPIAEVSSVEDERSPLLPERHALDLFFLVEPVGDITFKGDIASFEHPFFTLSAKPDHKIRTYEHKGTHVTVTPSVKGLANIYDGDILLYLMSYLRRAMNNGQPASPLIRFTALDFLVTTNRPTGGSGYIALREGLERLAGTRIGTNIVTGGKEVYHNFSLIDHFTIVKETRSGRMLEVAIKLSDWLYRAVDNGEVLTVNRDYFRLRGALERKLYQLARKHCGNQPSWAISFEVCHKKSGTQSSMKEFRRMVREIVQDDGRAAHFPDYEIQIDGSNIMFRRRASTRQIRGAADRRPYLSADVFEEARKFAPGQDVYCLESDWIDYWRSQGSQPLRNPDAAFLGYCKARFDKPAGQKRLAPTSSREVRGKKVATKPSGPKAG